MPISEAFTQLEALHALLADNELAILELDVLLARSERSERVARYLPHIEREDVARPMFNFLVDGLEEAALLRMESLRARHNRHILLALLEQEGRA